MKKEKDLTKAMVEASLMIAFATVLSLFKLVEMPYGGSVTLASSLPILIVAYRHGVGMGLSTGFAYAVIQQLLGLNNLSYVTGWVSVLAVILLDYLFAFAVIGVCGAVRSKRNPSCPSQKSSKQRLELCTGMGLACVLRYIMHVISGATVWAGLSIPTEAALIYSLGYNATYMLPETVISVLITVWIGGTLDFSKDIPITFTSGADNFGGIVPYLPGLAVLSAFAAVIAEVLIVCPHLQSPEDGRFTFELLGEVNIAAVIIAGAVGIGISAVLMAVYAVCKRRSQERA